MSGQRYDFGSLTVCRENRAGGRRPRSGLPKLVRFLAGHAALGGLIGILVAGALVWLDVGGLATLFFGAQSLIAPIVLYFGSFVLTFASAAMGTAIMLLPKDEDTYPPAQD